MKPNPIRPTQTAADSAPYSRNDLYLDHRCGGCPRLAGQQTATVPAPSSGARAKCKETKSINEPRIQVCHWLIQASVKGRVQEEGGGRGETGGVWRSGTQSS